MQGLILKIIFKIILALGIISMSNLVNATKVPSFGFAPKSFPRDPVLFNQFAEHMLIGQILQPLIDTDQFGNVEPSIAKSWIFENNGMRLVFEIDQSIKFSNGQNVTSYDVKYSLDRHMENRSQSNAFLRVVKEIVVKDPGKLIINLKNADVSILKILSRDHLGIVPKGWKFDKNNLKPYVGTGAYVLEKIGDKWYLVENTFSKLKTSVTLKKLEMVYFSDDSFSIDFQNFPDIVPLLSKKIIEEIRLKRPELIKDCNVAEEMTFSQSSVWWNPKSKFFKNDDVRMFVLSFLNNQIEKHAIEKNLQLATSFIPVGIMGHLTNRLKFKNNNLKKKIQLKISSSTSSFNNLIESAEFKKTANDLGIDIDYKFISAVSVKEENQKFNPDLTIGSWGGGFNDPTGFLGPLEEDLGMSFEQYLRSLNINFKEAQTTEDWSLRANFFQEIAIKLIENAYMVPGFRNEQYSCISNTFFKKNISLRYTPRLINYSRK